MAEVELCLKISVVCVGQGVDIYIYYTLQTIVYNIDDTFLSALVSCLN